MNRLPAKTRAQVLNCLIEGCSIRSTVRMTGVSKKAVTRLLVEAGIGTIPRAITGNPDPDHISTSFVEGQNWTVRTTMRRYTRLSNGFSRRIENHMAPVALNYFAYNFIKIHTTLRTSPAMAAGVADRLFDVSDLVALLVEKEPAEAA